MRKCVHIQLGGKMALNLENLFDFLVSVPFHGQFSLHAASAHLGCNATCQSILISWTSYSLYSWVKFRFELDASNVWIVWQDRCCMIKRQKCWFISWFTILKANTWHMHKFRQELRSLASSYLWTNCFCFRCHWCLAFAWASPSFRQLVNDSILEVKSL